MTPKHLSFSTVLSNMTNICRVWFFPMWFILSFETCTWENWVYSETICFSRIFKVCGIQSYFLLSSVQNEERLLLFLASQGSFSAGNASDSQCLQFMSTKMFANFHVVYFYHISSLLQAPKDWIKLCNHPSHESLRRKKNHY